MHPVVEFLNKITKNGIHIYEQMQQLVAKVYVVACSVDAQVRGPLQGLLLFNAYFGCNWCLHPGEYHGGCVKYPLQEDVVELRDKAQSLINMFRATKRNPIQGFQYASSFINFDFFNIIWGFVVDYLHCCLEGVAEQITERLLALMNLSQTDMNVLDDLMKKITVPNQLHRLTKKLSERGEWKAREWENFVLY